MNNDIIGPGQYSFKSLKDPNIGRINASPETLKDIEIVDGVPTIKRKKGRPRKADKEETAIAIRSDNAAKEQAKVEGPGTIMTNESPVIDRYQDTTNILRHSIMQMDQLASELKQELDTVRTMKSASLTAKTKYDAITGMASTIGQLIKGKVEAVREINKSITESNNAEIKRFKEIGDRNASKSSEEQIMEMYNAYINMPVGTYANQFPTTIDATTGQIITVPMVQNGMLPVPQQITPEMNRMMLDGDPNITTVLVNDPVTNESYFDVIDRRTGQSIPNYPRPSQMILEGTQINPSGTLAVNRDLNLEYDVIQRPSNPEYQQTYMDPNTSQVLEDMQSPEIKRKGSAKDSF